MIVFFHFSKRPALFFHVSLTYMAIGFLWLRFGWNFHNFEDMMSMLDSLAQQNESYRMFVEQNFDIIEEMENDKYTPEKH